MYKNPYALVQIVFITIQIMVRWFFGLIYGKKGESMPPIRDAILLESTTALARKIRQKKLKCVDVIKSFKQRIEEINPVLNCVVCNRFDKAIKTAQQYDQILQSNQYTEYELEETKPLFGVPFTTKDCIAVKGMKYTSGLYSRKDIIAESNADCIQAMIDAGAIPLAITNVSELCMWWESSNTIYGRTNNPYNTSCIVGGSSGGEGCIQASCGSACGIGSDIGGSIRMPAFFNGIFGHKPSMNTVSNNGQYPCPKHPEENGFLGIGPMCRYAEDLTLILKVIAGKEMTEKLKLNEKVELKNLKIFYQENDGGSILVSAVQPDVKEALRKVVGHFKQLNFPTRKIQLDEFKDSTKMWLANMKFNDNPPFAQLLSKDGQTEINVYWELLKWCFHLSKHTFIALMTAITENHGVKYGSEKHKYLVQKRNKLQKDIQEMLADNGVLLYPTHPTPAPYHNEPIFKPFNFSYTGIVNILGFPATHCPIGLSKHGLPVGIQVIANVNQDRLCIAVAKELEKAFGGWTPPKIEL